MNPPFAQTFSILADLPWGEPDGIIPQFEVASSRGKVSKIQARQVYTRPRIRLDKEGGIYILNSPGRQNQGDIRLYLFRDGRLTNRIVLPSLNSGEINRRILDFVPGFGKIFLLEIVTRQNTRYNQVIALDLDGSVLWRKVGLHAPNHTFDGSSLEGSFQKLILWQEATLLLIPAVGTGRFGRIDAETGTFSTQLVVTPYEQLQTFATCKGDLVRTVFLANQKLYGMTVYTSETEQEHLVVGSTKVYGALQFAYGIDDDLSLYTHIRNTQNKISSPGLITFTDHLLDLAYEPETESFLALRLVDNRLKLSRVSSNGTYYDCWLEPLQAPEPYQQYCLIFIQEYAGFHVYKREGGTDPGSVLVFSDQGQQINAFPFLPQNDAPLGALAPFRDWQVTCNGLVILPLTTERGLVVVSWDQQNEKNCD